jgi:hypothetical protein
MKRDFSLSGYGFCSAQDILELLAGEGAKGHWGLTPSPNPLKGVKLGRNVGPAPRFSGLLKGMGGNVGGGRSVWEVVEKCFPYSS